MKNSEGFFCVLNLFKVKSWEDGIQVQQKNSYNIQMIQINLFINISW
jgi:hypothetical protein